jgi:glutaredoxin
MQATHRFVKGEMHMPTDGSAIIVYGTTWCPDCRRSKQFLAENRIQYAWVDIEQDPVAMAEVERLNEGRRVVPTLTGFQFPDRLGGKMAGVSR